MLLRPTPVRMLMLLTLAIVASASAEERLPYDEAHPAAGFWVGELALDEARHYVVLDVDRDDDDRWTVKATIADFLLLAAEARDVSVDAASVAFVLTSNAGRLRVHGSVAGGGQRLEAEATVEGDEPRAGPLTLGRSLRVADLARPVAYSGALTVQGMQMGMTIIVHRTPAGRTLMYVDIPLQMTHGFPLADVVRDGRTLAATLPSARAPARLALELSEDDSRLTGTLTQMGMVLAIDFERDHEYVPAGLARPQHPAPPYPYEVVEVTLPHPEGHILAGTLTIPSPGDPFPAVVLISGSGPQDRDETIFGHKPFLVLADHLTRNGIAVLRFDDRGAGRSTGSFGTATSRDFAGDVQVAVEALAARSDIDPAAIGLIGHSEGGLIAPMLAAEDDRIAFIVLLAGPGVPGDALLRLQGKLLLEANGVEGVALDEMQARQTEMFRLMRTVGAEAELRAAIRAAVTADAGATLGEKELEQVVDAQLAQVSSPWMRFFIDHDPRPTLAGVRCPILACNGTLDLQVWHEQNLDEIERVVNDAGGWVTIRRYEGLNHLFQPALTGGIEEYGAIETTIDPQVLADVTAWIHATLASPRADPSHQAPTRAPSRIP